MRVLFYQFFPGGGIGRYTHELASAMTGLDGAEVHLICPPDFEHLVASRYRVSTQLMPVAHQWPLIRKARFLTAQFINPWKGLRYGRSIRADVIHFSNINHLSYPFWRSQLERSSAKVVATAHDVRRAAKILSRRWETKALVQFYRNADALFVHSQEQVGDLIEFADVHRDRIHLVPHGLYSYPRATGTKADLRRELGVPLERAVALYFGMVRADKNLDGLMRAIARMQEARPFLLIAGRMGERSQESESYYRSLVGELGLEADVKIVNEFIPETGVGSYFQAADFCCLTYRKDFTSQSGVLNVAMAFDMPVLVTPAPTLAETVRRFDVGLVCADDSPAAIATGCRDILERRQTGEPFAFDAYQQAHSWRANAEQTLAVYRQL